MKIQDIEAPTSRLGQPWVLSPAPDTINIEAFHRHTWLWLRNPGIHQGSGPQAIGAHGVERQVVPDGLAVAVVEEHGMKPAGIGQVHTALNRFRYVLSSQAP